MKEKPLMSVLYTVRAVSGDWCRRDNLEEGLGINQYLEKKLFQGDS